ncbi:hypothetical protein IFO70_12275 [Phormidium tenue FACHB-886]|nr:hypothetical protein [Phormidium tenue FACHB-886]
MKKNYSLLLLSLATLTLGYSTAAQAEEIPSPALPAAAIEAPQDDRLAVPPDAVDVPVGASDTAWTDPPPPPDPAEPAPPQSAPPQSAPPIAEATPVEPPAAPPIALSLLETVKTAADQKPVELNFGLASDGVPEAAPPPIAPPPAQPSPAAAAQVSNSENLATLPLNTLFAGDSESLVAKAVGSAEGTRTPNGDRNPAYYGHIDPGNKAWNQGSFSYQHGATSPEEADRKQLQRLQEQAAIIQATAIANGINLTLEEALNGIDLANQAPKAALDREGYIDWLVRARAIGKTGEEAILWARIQSYIDPVTQRWNAPGLGNNEASISHDQARRMEAIARAIAVYQQHQPAPSPAPEIAKASLHTLSEEIGLARLFKEKVVSQFSAPPEIAPEAASTLQSTQTDNDETLLASADLLFSLDLHP